MMPYRNMTMRPSLSFSLSLALSLCLSLSLPLLHQSIVLQCPARASNLCVLLTATRDILRLESGRMMHIIHSGGCAYSDIKGFRIAPVFAHKFLLRFQYSHCANLILRVKMGFRSLRGVLAHMFPQVSPTPVDNLGTTFHRQLLRQLQVVPKFPTAQVICTSCNVAWYCFGLCWRYLHSY